MVKHYQVIGKVRGIMFRQTFIRAAQKLDLRAGASNVTTQPYKVRVVLEGEQGNMERLLEWLTSGSALNSWGASVDTFEQDPQSDDISHYQVTTENVDSVRWNPNIKLHLDDL